jgi:hypothetical protein
MNKTESGLEKSISDLGVSNRNYDQDSDSSSSSSESDLYDDAEEDEEEFENFKGLFSDKLFNNFIDLFKHEAEQNDFNIVNIVHKYDMTMIDYIKMINFIRKEVRSSDSLLCS